MNDGDSLKYFMASEKVLNMIFTVEQAMEFFTEYNIEADDEVKKALTPILEQLKKWIS